jgi:hypothetical protein
LWLSRGQEKNYKEENNQEESWEKEITAPTAIQTNQYHRSACGGIISNTAVHRIRECTDLNFLSNRK